MAAHQNDARFTQDARCSPLEHRKVCVRSNRNYHCSAIDASFQQRQRIVDCSGRGRNSFWPITAFLRQRRPGIETPEARIRTRGYRDITPTSKRQPVTRVTRALSSMLGYRRDAAQVRIGPLENHGNCTEIVDVSTDVGIDMNVSQRSAMVEVSVSIAERYDSIQRNRCRNGA